MGEREKGNDRQQMAGGGIEPCATAAELQSLYMGCPLYQLSYLGASTHVF